MFALGKKAARDWQGLRLGNYLAAANVRPVVPKVFGTPWLVQNWRMLGNAQYGDCVWAGAAHETMLLRAAARWPVPQFSDASVLGDYAACTGFEASDPSTDQGTDVQQAAAYRQKIGVLDANGFRHKIGSYAGLKAGDLNEVDLGAYELGVVGIGVQLPVSAIDQFNRAEPWSVVSGSPIEGGHYVPLVGRNSLGKYLVVTWGRLQAVEWTFLADCMDEGLVYVSAERLNASGRSPLGIDLAGLQKDFEELTS